MENNSRRIIAIILGIGLAVICAFLNYKRRKDMFALYHQERMAAIEKGVELPPLPEGVIITRDEREGRGPLEGLLAGLTALAPHCDAAYATSCDVPLLVPAFVREMIARLDGHDIAVPVEGQFHHPLAALYRTRAMQVIGELLAADQLRPVFLFDRVATCRVPVSELTAVDPRLDTLKNLNRPEDYLAALAEEGFAVEPAILASLEMTRT